LPQSSLKTKATTLQALASRRISLLDRNTAELQEI